MSAMLHAFTHLFVHIAIRWITFLGTSVGGIAAQILILVLTEVQGGWWRLQAWKTSWRGGLKRAGLALASVWFLTFGVCIITTVYDDHRGLVEANRLLREENDKLRKPITRAEDSEKQKRLAIRVGLGNLLARNNELRDKCESDVPPKGFSCVKEKDRWIRQARSYIFKNMEPSYLARFKATTGIFAYYRTHSGKDLSEQDNEAVNFLSISSVALDQFIKEFQN